ncbi:MULTISPECIES: DMT family transporter [unclassified Haladaptatus]|uniref:DMT family transporter n=1 Tax=unclassified Haladaptatus TaxID=2622732 RepID=UPI002FCDF065
MGALPSVFSGELLALGAALISSVGYVSARRGLADASAEVLVTATTLVSVVLLLPFVFLSGIPTLSPEAVGVFIASGILGSGLGRFMLSHVIGKIGAGVTHAVKSASPVTAAVFSVLFLGETLSPPLAVGIVIVVLGLILLTRRPQAEPTEPTADTTTTAILALVIVLWFGVTPVIRKFGLSVLGTPLLPALTLNFAAGLLVGVVISLYTDSSQLRRAVSGKARNYLLLTGVCWTVAIGAYFTALSRADAVVVVPIFNSSPLFTVALSIFLLGEREAARPSTLIGAVVTVVGVVLITLG